jgi:hypothetical protein
MTGFPFDSPTTAIVAEETGQQLIDRARLADSDASWTVGECATVDAEVRSGPNACGVREDDRGRPDASTKCHSKAVAS